VVAGVHAKLESISETGEWLWDHTFEYGGVTVERKKGQKVGPIMTQWRSLRQNQPQLFTGEVKIWQSPTAYVDNIIYSWQIAEEQSRFPQTLRLVDSLSTHWSELSQETNWLLQAAQASVPAGMTPVLQLTDTAFAGPAKAAARMEHERQKSLFCLKAAAEGVRPTFRVGAREMLLTATAMHKRMRQLNDERNTVLSELRATGWLHYRPRDGRLARASEEQWAACLTEGTHKMGHNFRGQREQHVVDGRPQLEAPAEPEKDEENYFQDPDVLELAAEPDLLPLVEQRRLEALLLHPSVRSEVEQELAELEVVTSQRPRGGRVKSSAAKKCKLTRMEKVAAWRAALGGSTVASRLASLVAHSSGGKRARKAAKKHTLKVQRPACAAV
jgi:hypothetical protein